MHILAQADAPHLNRGLVPRAKYITWAWGGCIVYLHWEAVLRPKDEICDSQSPASFSYVLYLTHTMREPRGFSPRQRKTPVRMIHIGRMIEGELRQQERSVAWFARKLCCNRQNVYDIFKRESVDTTLLRRISSVLGRDFFRDLSEDISR